MTRLLKKLWYGLFPIDRKKAVKIAMKAVKIAMRSRVPDINQFRAFETLPGNMTIYSASKESCWYVTAPWGDGLDGSMLRSSRIIIISKKQAGCCMMDQPMTKDKTFFLKKSLHPALRGFYRENVLSKYGFK